MSAEKLLSVSVPSYNAAATLAACVDSMLAQPLAEYLEILIVDDGSTDDTAKVGASFAEAHPGIVRLIRKENGGHGSAVNKGLENAHGLYFRNVDSDDTLDSAALHHLLEGILDGTLTEDVISSDYHRVVAGSGETVPVKSAGSLPYDRTLTFADAEYFDFRFTIHSMMIRTELLKKTAMPLSEHTFFVDCELMLFPVPNISTFRFLSEPLYNYTVGNAAQSIDPMNMVKRADHHERVLMRVLEYAKTADMDAYARRYYNEVLLDMVRAHLQICLSWDKDRRRGCARAKAADEEIRRIDPAFADLAGEEIRLLKTARSLYFKPALLAPLITLYEASHKAD